MKRYTILFFLLVICAIACNEAGNKAVKETGSFEIINEEIMTHFPGGLFCTGKYIIWNDPFAKDYFLHVLDVKTGVELGVMGNCGQGPEEFISPMTDNILWNGLIFTTDVNGLNKGYLSADNLLAGKKPFIRPTPEDDAIRKSGYSIRLGNDLYMGNTEDGEKKPYRLYAAGQTSAFGNYPVTGEKIHLHAYHAFFPDKNILVSVCTSTKHIAAYQLKNNQFESLWEIRSHADYDKQDDRIIFNDKKRGPYDVCLTKDYIVTIERDYETDFTDEATIGRDISKLPQTLFIYDYNGNLLKIIDYKVSFGRIAGDMKSNTVYAIVANPDFMLIKINLQVPTR